LKAVGSLTVAACDQSAAADAAALFANVFQRSVAGSLQELQDLLASPQDEAAALSSLVRLKVALETIRPRFPDEGRHPLLDFAQSTIWPILSAVVQVFGADGRVVEKLCHATKYLVRILNFR
jgi:hypothetical protein